MFDRWMEQVDLAVEKFAGVSVYDLPDYNFRDAFEMGDTPEEVASQVLMDEGWDFAQY